MSGIQRFLYNEEKAMKQLKVATTAMQCQQDPVENRKNMVSIIEDIMQKDPDVDLIIFGEMILGWYTPYTFPEYHREISEPIPGKTSDTIASLAKKHKVYISFGISELNGEVIHNSQVLLNPQGEIQTIHRKNNLMHGEIKIGYQPGPIRVTETEIKGVKTAMIICSDSSSPKTLWKLATGKYELIIHSLIDDYQDDLLNRLMARMFDAWQVSANRYGKEHKHFWPGNIVVADPMGNVRSQQKGENKVLVYDLNFAITKSGLKRIIRNIWVKVPLFFMIIKNLKKIKAGF